MKVNFKVGNKVYCSRFNRCGIIVDIKDENDCAYPIIVKFRDIDYLVSYTIKGKYFVGHSKITLVLSLEPKIKKLLEDF